MGNGKLIIVAILGLTVSVAWADKLSDFEAAGKEVDEKPPGKAGCKSIRYSDYRSPCETEGGHVHEWCDGSRGPITCDSENISRQAKDNLERAKKAGDRKAMLAARARVTAAQAEIATLGARLAS